MPYSMLAITRVNATAINNPHPTPAKVRKAPRSGFVYKNDFLTKSAHKRRNIPYLAGKRVCACLRALMEGTNEARLLSVQCVSLGNVSFGNLGIGWYCSVLTGRYGATRHEQPRNHARQIQHSRTDSTHA